MKSICVFLGSSAGTHSSFQSQVENFVKFIADQRYKLVYGASARGLMKNLADNALQLGVDITGVITKKLILRETLHPGLTKVHIVETMSERIDKLVQLSDMFVVFPGGLGTVEELMKVWVLKKIGEVTQKPLFVLNLEKLYTPFLSAMKQLCESGFMTLDEYNMLIECQTLDELMLKITDTVKQSSGSLEVSII